jgi:hypothetical protein
MGDANGKLAEHHCLVQVNSLLAKLFVFFGGAFSFLSFCFLPFFLFLSFLLSYIYSYILINIFMFILKLFDRLGNEINEGDIVKINRYYMRPIPVNRREDIEYKLIEGEIEIGQVIWGWNTQKYLVSYEHIRYDDSEDFDKSSHRVEVIGNIFEHENLLK